MKKLLSTILCASLMSINLACCANEAPLVKVNMTNVPLKSPLQDKYSAYRIDYINEGQNPIRVNDVKCYNRIAVADAYSSYKISKKTIVCTILALPTLGISTLFAAPDILKQQGGVLTAQNEARRFNGMDYAGTEGLKTSNEILGQGQSLQFNILVPLSETPEMAGSFEDVTTHKYIRVEK